MKLVRAELLKLNRWSTWILVGVTALFQVLVGYVLVYFIAQIPADEAQGGPSGEILMVTLQPEYLISSSLTTLASLGGALALVIGALLSAREYGWRTVSMLLTQGATRLAVFAGKAAALGVVLVIMVTLTFLASTAGTVFVATQTGAGLDGFPPMTDFVMGAMAALLIVATWAALGYALGYVLRSTGLAIGLGLVYALVIETIISGFGAINTTFEAISRAMIGVNGSALAASFGPELPPELTGIADISPPFAAAVLAAYLVVALAVGAVAFSRRDVT